MYSNVHAINPPQAISSAQYHIIKSILHLRGNNGGDILETLHAVLGIASDVDGTFGRSSRSADAQGARSISPFIIYGRQMAYAARQYSRRDGVCTTYCPGIWQRIFRMPGVLKRFLVLHATHATTQSTIASSISPFRPTEKKIFFSWTQKRFYYVVCTVCGFWPFIAIQ